MSRPRLAAVLVILVGLAVAAAVAASTPTAGGITIPVAELRTVLDDAPITTDATPPLPYIRSEYADGWSDSDGDCQSDRHEILIRESLDTVELSSDGCRAVTGRWVDRFDGAEYEHADQVTIDHLVSLADAHRSGAWAWDVGSKRRFAADLDFRATLGVVGASTNQSKADLHPGQWRPPLESAWCGFAVDWTTTKLRWKLTFRAGEVEALNEMLGTCPPSTTALLDPAAPVVAPTPVVVTPTPVRVASEDGQPVVISCDARAERVVIENRGAIAVDLGGWVLHDEGENHSFRLDGLRIAAADRLVIVTGDQISDTGSQDLDPAEPTVVVWKRTNVWNNAGDTAYLIGPDTSSSAGC